MANDFVTEGMCKERRESTEKAMIYDRECVNDWINKLEKKIDAIIWLIVVQLLGMFGGIIVLIITGKLI